MSQLAMIAKGGESTILSVADGREVFTSEPVDPEKSDKNEIQSTFCKLNTAELLKHLLSTRLTTRTQSTSDKTNAGDETKKKRKHDSSQEAEAEMCGDATDSFATEQRTFYPKLSSDTCELASDILPSCAIDVQHGRMDKQCDGQNSDNFQSHLFTSEVQTRENLQRNVSEESSLSEQLSDEEISSLSKTILESNALDFILSGTEEKLCIQSPSQNEKSSDYNIDSEFNDFTELLPYVGNPTKLPTSAAAFSPVASTSGVASGDANTPEAESGVKSGRSKEAKTCSDSDQDIENAMVLVPSGDPNNQDVVQINQEDRIVGGPQEQDIVVPIIQRDRMFGRPQKHEIVVPNYENDKIASESKQQYTSPIVVGGPYELVPKFLLPATYRLIPQKPKSVVPVYEDGKGSLQQGTSVPSLLKDTEEQTEVPHIKGNSRTQHYKENVRSHNRRNKPQQEELVVGKNHSDKIVGGHGANIADYPYQLSLILWRRFHFCGAVLIAQKWALTAAHCTYGKFPFDLFVRAGSTNYGSGGQVIPVSQVVEHDSYFRDSADYDISILELASDVNTKNAKPIGLISTRPKPGDEATVSGWGRTSLNDRKSPAILQVVKLPVIDQKVCTDIYGKRKNAKYLITDRMFCAGHIDHGGQGACLGDSGGPITVGGKLAGLVSWGRGCAVAGYPGVYASIADLKEWIEETVKTYTY